jgi:beta-lactamase regulating signal transducer with metallopeptidase domain
MFNEEPIINTYPGLNNFTDAPITSDVSINVVEKVNAMPMLSIEIVWMTGMFVGALFFAVTYVKCNREFKTSLPVRSDTITLWLDKHPLRRKIQIRQSDRIKTPLTYGVFHPVILLPKNFGWTDEIYLNIVLTHEYVHIRQWDTLKKLVLTAAVCVHWFNPFVWIMYLLANRDVELSCDEKTVHGLGENIKTVYAMTLIELEEQKNRFTPLVNHFSKNAIEERIVSIMKIKKKSIVGIVLALTLVTSVSIVFATSAKAGTADSKNDTASVDIADSELINSSEITFSSEFTMSYVKEEDGKTYYSEDGGKTWSLQSNTTTSDVVWWTYEEYKDWIDNEKVELQKIIGAKGYTPSKGWFVWTQKDVDETVKLYEENLQGIKDGIMLSKTVNGDDNIVISIGTKEIDTEIN